jgi:hypothetical protein
MEGDEQKIKEEITRCIHSSVLHRYQCIAGRKAHAIFADDAACLTANNVWNEGK